MNVLLCFKDTIVNHYAILALQVLTYPRLPASISEIDFCVKSLITHPDAHD